MRLLYTLLIFLGSVFSATLPAQTGEDASAAYIREHFTKKEVMIPMRDGVKLFTSVYMPKDTTKIYPILLCRTPYSCAPYGEEAYKSRFQNMHLAKAGYIFVFQDVRGRYMSEGEFVDVRPFNLAKRAPKDIDEASDTYDTADWMLKNLPRNNGSIGVYGISYPGFYATMAILSFHPAIKAVSPQAPVTDWFMGDDFHHNGAFFLMDAFSFYSGFGKPRPTPTTEGAPGFSDYNTPDNYDFYLKTGALRNFNRRHLEGGIPFWNELMQHPDYDAWWKARNPRPHLSGVNAAVLTVGGHFDAEDCFGAWRLYEAIEKQNPNSVSNRLVMGPWCHGCWARTAGDQLGNVSFDQNTSEFFQKEIEFKFFEFYLKDQGNMTLPEAFIFETGRNTWTTYEQWPPGNASPTKFFFQIKGGLSTTAPADSSVVFDEYVSDPAKPVPYTEDVHLRRTNAYMTDDQRFAARRSDVLTYDSGTLRADVTVTGTLTAELWVSTTGTDADFVVKLIDVFPDTLSTQSNNIPLGGYQMLVRGEVMRGRYRNSFEKPEAFKPGQPTLVRFELPDIAHTFKAGHKLMVQVQSSWFPLVDRNPQQFVNIYEAKDEDFIKANHRIYRNAKYPSGIILPVKR
ncbi:MAG: CocE/NonD family hydrolase [Saprospiraceae bacterium]